METVNESTLLEEAQNHLEEFLEREKRSLLTFTRDAELRYIPDPTLEKFKLSPAEGIVYLPLASFLDRSLDENQMMWHLYYQLAAYPDWKKNPEKYLLRKKDWQLETEAMTLYLLKKVQKAGLLDDPAYQADVIYRYAEKEIQRFLRSIDQYIDFLRVMQLVPLYRTESSLKKIKNDYIKTGKTAVSLSELPLHQSLANSFLTMELYGEEIEFPDEIAHFYHSTIFGESFFTYFRRTFIQQIIREEGIHERDPFIKTFLFPYFESFWKFEIDQMNLEASKGQQKEAQGSVLDAQEDSSLTEMEFTEEDEQKVFEEMLEKQEREHTLQKKSEGKENLQTYGITASDQELFHFYEQKMKKEREEMKRFWEKIIGEARKEISVKTGRQSKGKLNVESLVKNYPEFKEAEKKGNYHNLLIFDQYLLQSSPKELPEKIEISFIIDNSGSINPSKIEAAQKALTAALLSIEDLRDFLQNNADNLQQNIEVITETWFFGTNFHQVKEFGNGRESSQKSKSDLIKSIVKIDGQGGSTDDGSILQEIADKITPEKERELRQSDLIKIIFEITDGASDFPGKAKQAVNELLEKKAEVFAFQIGKTTKADENVFNYIWNENSQARRGVIIGEDIHLLPQELLKAVQSNIESIFNQP